MGNRFGIVALTVAALIAAGPASAQLSAKPAVGTVIGVKSAVYAPGAVGVGSPPVEPDDEIIGEEVVGETGYQGGGSMGGGAGAGAGGGGFGAGLGSLLMMGGLTAGAIALSQSDRSNPTSP
jgi:hypothetical protein